MNRLPYPATYLITAGKANEHNFETASHDICSIIRDAVSDGVTLIQIREKDLTARLLHELAESAVGITRGTGVKLFINDRLDIALAAGADGIHLRGDSLPPAVVRGPCPQGFLIVASVHTAQEAADRVNEGADAIVYGPIFGTPGKGEPKGLAALEEVCTRAGDTPVIAIGGIDETNCASVLSAGAGGVAAIRALNSRADRRRLIKALNES